MNDYVPGCAPKRKCKIPKTPYGRFEEKYIPVDVFKIKRDNRTLKEIAKDYNVTFGAIGHIKNNRNWRSV